MSSFGTNFVIVSDIVQPVPGLAIGNPPERVIHHATIKRGLQEYVVLASESSNELYLNRVERNRATFSLESIKDDEEYKDLVAFLTASGIFNMGAPKKYAN